MAGHVIREAGRADLGQIVRMTFALHDATDMGIPFAEGRVASFAQSLINRSDGLALVIGEPAQAMLCASIERPPLSDVTLGVEHGLYAPMGGGLALVRRYVGWARDQGAWGARLSMPSVKHRAALTRLGFRPVETAYLIEF